MVNSIPLMIWARYFRITSTWTSRFFSWHSFTVVHVVSIMNDPNVQDLDLLSVCMIIYLWIFQQLHSSVRTNNLETCLRLLSKGADPNYFHPVSEFFKYMYFLSCFLCSISFNFWLCFSSDFSEIICFFRRKEIVLCM